MQTLIGFGEMSLSRSLFFWFGLCLFLLTLLSLHSETGEPAQVNSARGLPLRDQPSFTNSKIMLMMPDKASVKVLDKDGPLGEWQGVRGPWMKIQFEDKVGWSFSPFLKIAGDAGKSNFLADGAVKVEAKRILGQMSMQTRMGASNTYICENGTFFEDYHYGPVYDYWVGSWRMDGESVQRLEHMHCQLNQATGEQDCPIENGAKAAQAGKRGSVLLTKEGVSRILEGSEHFNRFSWTDFDQRGVPLAENMFSTFATSLNSPRNGEPDQCLKGFDLKQWVNREAEKAKAQHSVSFLEDAIKLGAAAEEQIGKLKSLIASSANINEQDADGNSALHIAAREGHLQLLQSLLAAKANVNIANKYGETPIFKASYLGRKDIVNALLAAGAKPGVRNTYGQTPLSMTSDQAIKDALRAAGAKE